MCRCLVAGIILLATTGAEVSSKGVDRAAKVCRRSCTAALGECVTSAEQERTTRLAACKSGAADRRDCQREAARAAHATGRACRNLRKGCTACCRASARVARPCTSRASAT